MAYIGRTKTPAPLTSADIPDGIVSAADLAPNSVAASELANDAVDTNAIINNAVTGDKIEDNPTIAGNLTVTGDLVASTPLSHRNMIINGGMQVAQRGTSFTGDHTGSGAYTIDRWKAWQIGGGDITIEQSTEVPEGFTGGRSLKGTVTTVDSSIAGTDYYAISQYIEGQNIVGIDFGESTAKTLTLSFYVKTSVTGTYGGAVRNNAGNKMYPFHYVVANTNWNRYTITFTGATDGTWLYTNALGLSVFWGLGIGTTYTDTAGSWTTKSSVLSGDSSLNWIATNAATYHLTGVQLELGSNATPFEHRSYGEELARCQRYWERAGGDYAGCFYATTACEGCFSYLVEKRATPTLTSTGNTITAYCAGTGLKTFSAISVLTPLKTTAFCELTGGSATNVEVNDVAMGRSDFCNIDAEL